MHRLKRRKKRDLMTFVKNSWCFRIIDYCQEGIASGPICLVKSFRDHFEHYEKEDQLPKKTIEKVLADWSENYGSVYFLVFMNMEKRSRQFMFRSCC
jgi:hypothetical protein